MRCSPWVMFAAPFSAMSDRPRRWRRGRGPRTPVGVFALVFAAACCDGQQDSPLAADGALEADVHDGGHSDGPSSEAGLDSSDSAVDVSDSDGSSEVGEDAQDAPPPDSACVPVVCGNQCGVVEDGCGGFADCGDCELGTMCGVLQPGVCGPAITDGIRDITVGAHACVLLDPGRVRCWGPNQFGELGNGLIGHVGDDEAPSSMGDLPMGGTVAQVSAGSHICAVYVDGRLKCWGGSTVGALGYPNVNSTGTTTPEELPYVDVGGQVSVVVTGTYGHTCVLLDNGGVKCWGGLALLGQASYVQGTCLTSCAEPACCIGDDEPPSAVGPIDLGGRAIHIAVGSLHACAVLEDGSVRCWGRSWEGQLGTPSSEAIGDDEPPSEGPIVPLPGRALRVAAGDDYSCAMVASGQVWCWGDSSWGQTGVPGTESSPKHVVLDGPAVDVAAREHQTCALMANRSLVCWGYGEGGRLGYGNTDNVGDDESPASVGSVPLGAAPTSFGVGYKHMCAALDGNRVLCWGRGEQGRLGYGNTADCLGTGLGFCAFSPACCIGDNELPFSVGPVDVLGP